MADHIEVLDKSWLFENSTSIKFQSGLNRFLDFAEIYSNHKMEPGLKLPCPCSKCHNDKYYDCKTITEHVIRFSFDNAYTTGFLTFSDDQNPSLKLKIHR